jgi:hypothetical protein
MGRPIFQKYCDDYKRGKMDQRNTGFMLPLVKNISQAYQQGKLAHNEYKVTNSLGKRPR